MKVIFLGTNGWYCTETGETPCILIDSKKYYIVLDAGNGIRKLDKYIIENKPVYLFLSHFHLDHTFGLHVLLKFKFEKGITIVVGENRIKDLNTLVNPPFTQNFKGFSSKISVLELPKDLSKIPFPVESFKMFHQDEDAGYRFKLDEKIIAYSGDTGVIENSIPLAKNADLLIHECSNPVGMTSPKWGHANPEEVANLAKKAGVKKLALTHFDPDFYLTLEQRNVSQEAARKIFPETYAMRDDQVIEL